MCMCAMPIWAARTLERERMRNRVWDNERSALVLVIGIAAMRRFTHIFSSEVYKVASISLIFFLSLFPYIPKHIATLPFECGCTDKRAAGFVYWFCICSNASVCVYECVVFVACVRLWNNENTYSTRVNAFGSVDKLWSLYGISLQQGVTHSFFMYSFCICCGWNTATNWKRLSEWQIHL